MNRKLSSILLIDDSTADNYFHTIVLEEAGITDHISSVQSGEEALTFLTARTQKESPWPELIFLDINMPKMNGWEFLEEYGKILLSKREQSVLILLTTSLNPEDRQKAMTHPMIDDFANKPLDERTIEHILDNFFVDLL
ncbi:MAG: response regulator [Bacteroidota bacterium]